MQTCFSVPGDYAEAWSSSLGRQSLHILRALIQHASGLQSGPIFLRQAWQTLRNFDSCLRQRWHGCVCDVLSMTSGVTRPHRRWGCRVLSWASVVWRVWSIWWCALSCGECVDFSVTTMRRARLNLVWISTSCLLRLCSFQTLSLGIFTNCFPFTFVKTLPFPLLCGCP